MELGADESLIKPSTIKEFKQTVQRLLGELKTQKTKGDCDCCN
jgi:YesN/AraC family two-component response regulator